MKNPVPYLVSDYWSQYLALFGLIFVLRIAKFVIHSVIWMFRVYTPSLYRKFDHLKLYGEWAAITGCTAGIGLGLSKEIARRGMNVILISRNLNKLKELAHEIENEFKVKTKVIVNDASDRESTNKMAQELANLDVGILVNNVGINAEDKMLRFDESNQQWIYNLLTINTGNSALALKHVLPKMKAAKRGIIMNIGSSSCYVPAPLQALYGATKIYGQVLSHGLARELASTGIKIQLFCPLFVQSNMSHNISPLIHNTISISSRAYSKSCIDILGTCFRTGGHMVFDLVIGIVAAIFNEDVFQYIIYIIANGLNYYHYGG